jgi:hypothetical protein
VTDAGLVHLKGLTKLADFDLGSAGASDTGVADLRGLADLRTLNLGGTQITDRDFAHLKELNKLRCLLFYNTRVTEGGRARLERSLVGLHTQRRHRVSRSDRESSPPPHPSPGRTAGVPALPRAF